MNLLKSSLLGACAWSLALAAPALAGSDDAAIKRGPVPKWALRSEPMAVPADADGLLFVRQLDSQVHLEADGQRSYIGQRVKLLNAQALQIGNLAIGWNPQAGAPVLHTLKVYRGAQTIDLTDTAKFEILRREDQLEQAMLSGTLTAVYKIPDLRVGDELEIAFTTPSSDPDAERDQFWRADAFGHHDAGPLSAHRELGCGTRTQARSHRRFRQHSHANGGRLERVGGQSAADHPSQGRASALWVATGAGIHRLCIVERLVEAVRPDVRRRGGLARRVAPQAGGSADRVRAYRPAWPRTGGAGAGAGPGPLRVRRPRRRELSPCQRGRHVAAALWRLQGQDRAPARLAGRAGRAGASGAGKCKRSGRWDGGEAALARPVRSRDRARADRGQGVLARRHATGRHPDERAARDALSRGPAADRGRRRPGVSSIVQPRRCPTRWESTTSMRAAASTSRRG